MRSLREILSKVLTEDQAWIKESPHLAGEELRQSTQTEEEKEPEKEEVQAESALMGPKGDGNAR